MWKTALLIVVLLVALPFAGIFAGVQIGDATCNDPAGESIPDLRCLDDVIYGSVAVSRTRARATPGSRWVVASRDA